MYGDIVQIDPSHAFSVLQGEKMGLRSITCAVYDLCEARYYYAPHDGAAFANVEAP